MMPDSAWLQGALRKVVAAVLGLLLALVLLVALLITGFYMLVNAATLSMRPPIVEPSLAMVMNISPGVPSSKRPMVR